MLTFQEENRIIRNIGEVFINNDINHLSKEGYNFLYLCSGFIAHYDRYGFIANYSVYSLAQDILRNKDQNQYNNFSKDDKDFEYYMQKKRIYNKICGFARGDKRYKLPKLEDCIVPIREITSYTIDNCSYDEVLSDYKNHLAFGNYFNCTDGQRAVDLTDATLMCRHLLKDEKLSTIMNQKFKFSSGNEGTISSLLNCYRDSIYDIFEKYTENI